VCKCLVVDQSRTYVMVLLALLLLLLLCTGMDFFERIDSGATETCPGLSRKSTTTTKSGKSKSITKTAAAKS
jgi:hypothetical protein